MTEENHPFFLTPPELKKAGIEVAKALAAYSADLHQGHEFHDLMDPLLRDLVGQTSNRLHADSAAIWLVDGGRTELRVCYSHHNPQLHGVMLPLGRGLISLVLASEQSLCESEVWQHQDYDTSVDRQTGNTTAAMVAVPFYLGATLRGVVSLVRYRREGTPTPPFDAHHLIELQRLSSILSRLLSHRALQIILDLQDSDL